MFEELLPGLSRINNLHPLFVHFPIALWTTASGLFLGAAVLKREDLFVTARWLLYLGAFGAAASVLSGLLAAEALGHDSPGHDLVHVHRDFMYFASSIGITSAIAAFVMRKRQGSLARHWPAALLHVAVAVMLLGADRGAALVYVHGTGVLQQVATAGHSDEHHADDHHGDGEGGAGEHGHGAHAH